MNTPQERFNIEETEEKYPGIHIEWYNQKTIIAYRITHVTLKSIDRWGELVIETLKEWNKDRPYLALHDVSTSGVSLQYASVVNFDFLNIGITPALRLVAEDIFNKNPQFRARVALNFNLSFSGRMGKTLTSTFLDSHPSVGYKTFYNRDKAFNWLSGATGTLLDTSEMPKSS
ncbi:MAG: hypothetical protein MUF87_16465 [Anaerolineae bacterium]|nr:hypothetical protein [Anaerolineae bacterium]